MSKGIPCGSRDIAHVPTAPECTWQFRRGQIRTIGVDPLLSFQVTVIHDTWIEGVETLGEQTVDGELHLDRPVVIARNPQGEPLVTLTLRSIAADQAFIQVTANPKLRQGRRQ